jgi:glycosyltransferase involved in cell wall biosynthesis
MNGRSLVIIDSHPVPCHAVIYRELQTSHNIPVTAVYGSDFSVTGFPDDDFGAMSAWDTSLLAGYESVFLSRVADGGARSAAAVTTRGLEAALRAAAPKVVLIASSGQPFHRHASRIASRAGHPVMLRGEMNDAALEHGTLKSWLRDRALRQVYQRCDQLLYVGQRSREHFQRLGCPESKLVFSPHCVDPALFRADEKARDQLRATTRTALKIAPDRIIILVLGKLNRYPKPELILRAIKLLPSGAHHRIDVLFLGSEELPTQLQTLAQLPPAIVTHFLGLQNQSQLSKYYHAADMLVLPGVQSDTWGLVINDSLHHGLPCIVANVVGCTPDLIEPGATGEVFATGSENALATAINNLFPLINRADIRAKCREKVGGYTPAKAAEGIAWAFTDVVQNCNSKSPRHDAQNTLG